MNSLWEQLVEIGDIRTCVQSTLLESIERRVMVLSRMNQGGLVQDGTCGVRENWHDRKEDAAYITQASISL